MWIMSNPVETTPHAAPHPDNAPMMRAEDAAVRAET
jgi:hypothetical protein